MREGIGSAFLYNMVITFLAIIFGFVIGTLVYYKSFKINKRILSIVEKYEGFNKLSKAELDVSLKDVGYSVEVVGTCPKKEGQKAMDYNGQDTNKLGYCIYYFPTDTIDGKDTFYSFGVITYITFDFPVAKTIIRIPVYTKSNRIFRFK